jgi:hypothetical protein
MGRKRIPAGETVKLGHYADGPVPALAWPLVSEADCHTEKPPKLRTQPRSSLMKPCHLGTKSPNFGRFAAI